MKNIKRLCIAIIAISLWSCSEESLDPKSIFDKDPGIVENQFDGWLKENYTKTYNIDFKYRFEDKESDRSYNLAPAEYSKAVALAKITKHVWLESYEELAGAEFIRTYCPKIMFLVGSVAYNTQGSVVLGTAEGGLKITLYNVNSIDVNNLNMDMLNQWFFHVMHHEFAHILHQTKNYAPDFNLISAKNYQSSSWVNVSDKKALDMGFITPYASSETQEDFVEIISTYVTNTAKYWDDRVALASDDGKSMINQKLGVVKDYMLTSWGIDLDKLRAVVLRRSNEVLTMDLTTLN